MTRLRVVVRIFCALPFATGLGDLLLGAGIFEATGVELLEEAVKNPALNSQVGFWGAIWLGFGLLLWKTTDDLEEHGDWFRLLCGILFLSGVGRAIASARSGPPPVPLRAATAVELIGAPAVVLWHRALVRSSARPLVRSSRR